MSNPVAARATACSEAGAPLHTTLRKSLGELACGEHDIRKQHFVPLEA